jgi:phosphoribosylformylglycinamidine cyclo-ligase
MMTWLSKIAGITGPEMVRTFNCGIGMAVVVAPNQADAAQTIFEEHGETVMKIGNITEQTGGPQVKMQGIESWAQR